MDARRGQTVEIEASIRSFPALARKPHGDMKFIHAAVEVD